MKEVLELGFIQTNSARIIILPDWYKSLSEASHQLYIALEEARRSTEADTQDIHDMIEIYSELAGLQDNIAYRYAQKMKGEKHGN